MTGDQVPHKSRMRVSVLVALIVVLVGMRAICPVSNTLFLRPLLKNFDSRYVSANVEPMPFDRDLWRTGKGHHRVGMAHHLTDRKLLHGKTRDELVELLGEPDVERSGQEEMRWLLGFYAKGLFDETLWLRATVGEDGKVCDAGVGVDWDDPRRR